MLYVRHLILSQKQLYTQAIYSLNHLCLVSTYLTLSLAYPICLHYYICIFFFFFFSSRRRHTRCSRDWSSDVCSSDLCEASLRRLGVERIDLYQFHRPDETGTPVEDSWHAMMRLVEEGKVRAAGVSNFDVPLLERCEVLRHVDSLQPPFSLIRREAAAHEIPWCAGHDTGVIVYSPMQAGLLTDSFTAARVSALAQDDWRRRAVEFQEPNLSRNLALRDALQPIARRHGATVSSHRGGMDTRMAGRDGGDRRCSHGRAGGRLDRRRDARAHGGGSRRDRRGNRADGRGGGADAAGGEPRARGAPRPAGPRSGSLSPGRARPRPPPRG